MGSGLSDVHQVCENWFVVIYHRHWESIHSGLVDVAIILVSSSSRLDFVVAILSIKSRMVTTASLLSDTLRCSIKKVEDAFLPA